MNGVNGLEMCGERKDQFSWTSRIEPASFRDEAIGRIWIWG